MQRRRAPPRSEYTLAIIECDGGELIGYSRLALDPHQQRAATFGFALRPHAWGVRYGVEAVRLLLGRIRHRNGCRYRIRHRRRRWARSGSSSGARYGCTSCITRPRRRSTARG
ncbi:GNAT family N-acetyltransferase [Streptomyces sp. NPDC042319]|uniref:GNAT family N-acetyltransferase n=1 Tax=Streptomyces sp. NPDC042319 TaxID=3154332 RepID=UPI0033C3752A